ncbi:hypothetical protein [Streptomyces anulatus]|uniref:hypothetical protein n=1 Tax=Streptomyces anulatus TaxID=1892 RepID=UPI0036AF74E8
MAVFVVVADSGGQPGAAGCGEGCVGGGPGEDVHGAGDGAGVEGEVEAEAACEEAVGVAVEAVLGVLAWGAGGDGLVVAARG